MSLETRIRRLECSREEEFQRLAALVAGWVVDALERHVPDEEARLAVRKELAERAREYLGERRD